MIFAGRTWTVRLIRHMYAKTSGECCRLGVLVYFLDMYTWTLRSRFAR